MYFYNEKDQSVNLCLLHYVMLDAAHLLGGPHQVTKQNLLIEKTLHHIHCYSHYLWIETKPRSRQTNILAYKHTQLFSPLIPFSYFVSLMISVLFMDVIGINSASSQLLSMN